MADNRPQRAAPPRAHPPLTGGTLVLGTVALSLATFMNVLDTSIANVSIPAIAGDLGVSPDQGTWVITSFGVANAISCRYRLAHAALRTGAAVHGVDHPVRASRRSRADWHRRIEALIVFRVIQGAVAGR